MWSRTNSVALPTEWTLNNGVFRAILRELGEPGLDLFATCLNHKLPVYVSPCPDPKALALDALSLDWNTLPLVYAFPPMPILPKVLQKMKASTCRMILIAPAWPAQSWFPVPVSGSAPGVADLSGASLPDRRSSDVVSPEPSDVQLPRLDVIRSALSQRGFSERAANRIAVPQRSSTRLVYEGKWAEFCAWCDRRKEDPVQASVPQVVDFLTDLRGILCWRFLPFVVTVQPYLLLFLMELPSLIAGSWVHSFGAPPSIVP